MRHFKKTSPRTPIWLPNGSEVRFDTVDGRTGYFQTEDPYVLAALEKCIAEGRGGLSGVSPEEYAEFLKKKETSPIFVPPSTLPGFGVGVAPDTTSTRTIPPLAAPVDTKPVAPPQPKPVATKPRTGKRPVNPD